MFATIISYCTNDYRFIGRCIEEASRFSSQILVSVCDHFFDGSPENRFLLQQTYAAHPHCQFIEFAYLPDRLYSPYHPLLPDDADWAIFWAATTRYVGWHYLRSDIERVLFLDSDEIVEGENFLHNLQTGQLGICDAERLASYLYLIEPTIRSTKAVNLPLLVRKKTLEPLTLLNGLERIGAYQMHPGPKRECVLGFDRLPLVHHYSWVRTQEECLHKARTWGHRGDCDWRLRIENAFAGDPGCLVDDRIEIERIDPPYFDPLAVNRPLTVCKEVSKECANVIRVNDKELFRKGLDLIG
ncbi:MAG: hypothetical protein HY861_02415 [Chlamydiia bacterium]|nr:hypothetical protein [Chlamydiia bacterium]